MIRSKLKPLFLAFAMFTWTTQIVLLDWVFNDALYRGMEAPLWIFQIPLGGKVFYLSTWHAYLYTIFMLHVSLVLMLYALIIFRDGETRFTSQ